MKALILSAGLGTRLKPFTDKHPKALAQVNNQSLLEINIRRLQYFGIHDVVVNVHHFAEQIIETLIANNGFGSRFEISNETDYILETGGGLKKCEHFFKNNNNLLVMNVDILSNINLHKLIKAHEIQNGIAMLAVQQRNSSRYLLFGNKDNQSTQKLIGWKNETENNYKWVSPISDENKINYVPLAFSGIQVLKKKIFELITLEGKFSLIDLYLDIGGKHPIHAWDHTGDLLLDVGKPSSLKKAGQLFI